MDDLCDAVAEWEKLIRERLDLRQKLKVPVAEFAGDILECKEVDKATASAIKSMDIRMQDLDKKIGAVRERVALVIEKEYGLKLEYPSSAQDILAEIGNALYKKAAEDIAKKAA